MSDEYCMCVQFGCQDTQDGPLMKLVGHHPACGKFKQAVLERLADDARKRIDQHELTEKVRVLTEALEHYADESRWYITPCNDVLHGHSGHLCTKLLQGYNHTRNNGYDIAQTALKGE
jgi:hypothetical protein